MSSEKSICQIGELLVKLLEFSPALMTNFTESLIMDVLRTMSLPQIMAAE